MEKTIQEKIRKNRILKKRVPVSIFIGYLFKPKSPQESFYGSYIYDRIVPVDHLLRKINQVVDPVSSTGQAFLLHGKY